MAAIQRTFKQLDWEVDTHTVLWLCCTVLVLYCPILCTAQVDTHTDLTVAEIRRVVLEDVQLRSVQTVKFHGLLTLHKQRPADGGAGHLPAVPRRG